MHYDSDLFIYIYTLSIRLWNSYAFEYSPSGELYSIDLLLRIKLIISGDNIH